VLEWADILHWLKEVGTDNYTEFAADIAKAIPDNGLKAAQISVPFSSTGHGPNLSVAIEVINYEYEITPTVPGGSLKHGR